jgi:hypothetical protein
MAKFYNVLYRMERMRAPFSRIEDYFKGTEIFSVWDYKTGIKEEDPGFGCHYDSCVRYCRNEAGRGHSVVLVDNGDTRNYMEIYEAVGDGVDEDEIYDRD